MCPSCQLSNAFGVNGIAHEPCVCPRGPWSPWIWGGTGSPPLKIAAKVTWEFIIAFYFVPGRDGGVCM